MVSPYVPRGSVFHAAQGQQDFDHTSILATLEKRFGIPPLTDRDKNAPELGPILSLDNPRDDSAPVDVPEVAEPVMLAAAMAAPNGDVMQAPLNDLQRSIVTAMHFLHWLRRPFSAGLAHPAGPRDAGPRVN